MHIYVYMDMLAGEEMSSFAKLWGSYFLIIMLFTVINYFIIPQSKLLLLFL